MVPKITSDDTEHQIGCYEVYKQHTLYLRQTVRQRFGNILLPHQIDIVSKSLFQIIAKCERVNHWICLRTKLIGEINISIHVHLTA